MNYPLAKKILEAVASFGVKEICICAGARNAPFVQLLENCTNVKVLNFFEERSAGFFALGRIQASGLPVAVITTSGTAAAELLPAAIEATYQSLPLIMITADRPRRFRGTGAPQSIEQVGIFSQYTQAFQDIADLDETLQLDSWTLQGPLHLNVCFEEPERSPTDLQIDFASVPRTQIRSATLGAKQPRPILRPLVIVSSLKPNQRDEVAQSLAAMTCPIYAESPSGLWSYPELAPLLLRGGEKSVEKAHGLGLIGSILRVGGVPTLRFWRDLEEKYKDLPVYSIAENDYRGLSRASRHLIGLDNLDLFSNPKERPDLASIKDVDQNVALKISALLEKFPLSEVALTAQLAKSLPKNSRTFVGNSLPIRQWDLIQGQLSAPPETYANRGANGIDGQVSSFLGVCDSQKECWCVIGDLTAMYDLAGLWASGHAGGAAKRIVVINNHGGKIFKSMFPSPLFLNEHQLSFEPWAKMWGWSYQQWNQIPKDFEALENQIIIELKPNQEQSDQFWQSYQQL